MARSLPSTRTALRVAILIDLLRAHAERTLGADGLEGAVSRALDRRDPEGKVARRIVANVDALRPSARAALYGAAPPGYTRKLSKNQIRAALQPLPGLPNLLDDATPAAAPEFPAGTNFTITYTGLYCRERTGDRGLFGPSDEPYVIVAAVNVVNGENVVRTENVPVAGPKHYDDVDSGEWRRGPYSACWYGPASEVSLVVTVMEHDEGDPDAYREEIENLVDLAAAVAASQGVPIPEAMQELAADAVNWVIDSDDDSCGSTTQILSPELLREDAARSTQLYRTGRTVLVPDGPFSWHWEVVIDNTDLPFHFRTRHTDRGEYRVTFRVTADRGPLIDLKPDALAEDVGLIEEEPGDDGPIVERRLPRGRSRSGAGTRKS